jgi:hypothetical protein
MNESGHDRHSFIVKIWLEPREGDSRDVASLWRGRVTHVPSGLYYYFQDVDEIAHFIRSYIGEIEPHSRIRDLFNYLCRLMKG